MNEREREREREGSGILFTCVREVFKYMKMICHKIHKSLLKLISLQLLFVNLLMNLETFIYHDKKLQWVVQQRCLIIR